MKLHRKAIPLLAGIVLPAGLGMPAWGQLPYPEIRSIFPPGGQAGQTVEVTLNGSELHDCAELIFSHPGLSARPVMTPATEFTPERPVPGRFLVSIAADTPTGVYEVHANSKLGLSTPHTFAVSHLPEIVHAPNNDESAPMPLPLETVVNAHTDAEQIDYYRLDLSAGQHVVVRCRGEHIDSRIDATLVLLDDQGRELMRDRDTLGRDAVLEVVAEEAGSYQLQVFDFLYRGGPEFTYRLTASSAPHIDFVYPPAGPEGSTGKFKIYGRNLPGGSKGEGVRLGRHELESIEVDISLQADDQAGLVTRPLPDALTPGMEYRLEHEGLVSNPVRIGFATAPVVEGVEATEDQAVSVPVEVHGRFDQRGDLDRYRFEGRKGTSLVIECLADRLGTGTDPFVVVERLSRNEQGEEQVSELASGDDLGVIPGGPRFPAQTRDPLLVVALPDDGTYRVTVWNQSSTHGPAALYRLILREARPDFELLATSSSAYLPDKQAPRVPSILRRGGTATVTVHALRRDGFGGEIELAAEGLPSGVSCPPVRMRAGDSSTMLVFRSAEDAPDWDGFVTITGTAGDLSHRARVGTLAWTVANWDQDYAKPRLSTRLPLSVCAAEKAPVVVHEPEMARFEVDLDGQLDLPVKLVKNMAFKGDATITPVGLPYAKNPPQLKIKEADTEGTLSIAFKKTNEFPIAPGEWQFVLRAEGTIKFRHDVSGAEAAEAERVRLEELEKSLQEAAQQARAAVDPARQASEEAQRQVQSASPDATPELKSKAEEAQARFAQAEMAAQAAEEKVKAAAGAKNSATERAKQAAERAKERDVKHATYSLPITVVVKAPPPQEEPKQ